MASPNLSPDLQIAAQHHQAGRLTEAIVAYRKVLAAQPRHPDVIHMLALALHQSGNDTDAVPLFNRALMLDPSNASAWRNFLELWRRQQNWEKVLDCARKLVALRPADPQMKALLAGALAQAEKLDEAEAAYRRMLEANPADPSVLNALAEVLRQAKKFPQAEVEFQKVLRVRPTDAQAWIGYGETLRSQQKFEESLAAAQRAVQIHPISVDALHLMGWNLFDLRRPAEALPLVERGIRLSPNEPRLYWLRGLLLLMLGEFEGGWNNFESRWEVRGLKLKRPAVAQPQWRGEDVRGKVVYLHPEQGFGDTFQFIRYAPLILEKGAASVVAVAPPELHGILQRSMPQVRFFLPGDAMPHIDLHCPMMSLPLAFGTTIQTIPQNVPYLFADSQRTRHWRAQLAGYPGVKVGLAWAGRPTNSNDFHRTIGLGPLAALAMPGVQFISLQKGDAAAQIRDVPELNILDWSEQLKDFDDTAALLNELDLLISIDTSVVHLAGAMGRPAWLMIPVVQDFRWLMERTDSPWYPSLRIFRQPRLGDWAAVVADVRDELGRRVSSGRSDRNT